MYASHVAAGGLFLAALALGLQGQPVPRGLQKGSPGGAAALGRELAELLEASSGPAAAGATRGGGGTKAAQQQQQQQPAQKGKGASTASRLLRDLRTDTKQTRAGWTRAANTEHQPGAGGGGGGGGGGGPRRFKPPPKKGQAKGCFGLKLDRIGSLSGLGC